MSQPSSIDDSLSVQLGIVSSDSQDSSSSDQNQYLAAICQPSLDRFLDCPTPPRPKLPEQTYSTRVLTSTENLDRIQQKEREKQTKAQLVEERARKREEKKALMGNKKSKW